MDKAGWYSVLVQAFGLIGLLYTPVHTVTPGPIISEAYELINMDTCGKTKGCYRMPYGCNPTQNCDAIFTWKPVNDKVEFELGGKSDGPGWIAIGLSNDQAMGDDSVMECFFLPVSSGNTQIQVTTRFSFNSANKVNTVLTSPLTATMEKTDGRFYNSFMVCKFTRPQYTSTTDQQVFPIQQTQGTYSPYYLQLSLGKMRDSTSEKLKHGVGIPRVTQFKMAFNNLTLINGAPHLSAFRFLTIMSLTAYLL